MVGEEKRKRRYEGFDKRINWIGVIILLALVVLCARLWELQIVRWSEFRSKSDNNRLRIQRLESPRGMIVGYNGGDQVVLADNRAARDLMFVPAECDGSPEAVTKRLEQLVGIDGPELLERIEAAHDARQPHRQIVVKKDVPRSVLARVEEYAYALPGVITVIRPQRRYLYGSTAGQILGYLNEVNREELDSNPNEYNMGDLTGRAGLEKRYQELLHGTDGQMLVTQFARGRPQLRTDTYGKPFVTVDDFGHRLHVEHEIQDPVPGKTLQVSLDIGLQRRAEELLLGEEGAIVVLNADTGDVLALASAPGYDPSVFVKSGMSDSRKEVLTSKPNRMINRCFQEVYAPGSVFKILLAGAALEEGTITSETTFYCPGRFRLTPGGRPWHCWKRSGHGNVDVVDALAFSCDVFFYNVGRELGVDRIHAWAQRVGLGRKTEIDLPGEVAGLIPSREWREEYLKKVYPDEPWNQQWFPGDTINLSIGQGSAGTTPLQNAMLVASVINGGRKVRPHLRLSAEERVSEPIWSENTLRVVQKGLLKCVEKGPPAPTGTGNRTQIEGFSILGKTGSAQVASLHHHEQYETEEDIPKEIRDHAWFVAGVLDREPKLALCVLVEHGHHGSSEAAPLAKELIEYFYSRGDGKPLTVAKNDE